MTLVQAKSKSSNNGGGLVSIDDCLLERAWDHYKNFIDIIDNGDEENEIDEYENEGGEARGDIDELLELIEILSPYSDISFSSSSTCAIEFPHDGDFSQQTFLSILLSMANVHLASVAITDEMIMMTRKENDETTSSSTSSPEDFIQKALQHWSTNPIAYKLWADYHRRKCSERRSSLENVCTLYEKAAEYATYWRTVALEKMQEKDDEDNTVATAVVTNVNEWVELLIIQGALDVESIYIGNDDGDDEDEDGENDNVDEDGEIYTCSSRVESTSSFMSAYLLSTLSRHDEALVYLKKFHLSHRIHPNVWLLASNHAQLSSTPSLSSDVDFTPRIYRGSSDSGILPPELYEQLCHLFAPGASYWKESDYNNRGYYSYFIGLNDVSHVSPTNVIDDVIVNHLLPLANQSLSDNKVGSAHPIIGAEWWVHTRPLGANLGHQIHYDTDEYMLNSKKKVTHPLVSSVLYLTGARKRDCNEADASATQASVTAGSTIVFDQTPESTNVASQAWVYQPRDNSFLTFPGNLLHGVLPCTDVRVIDNNSGGVNSNNDEGLHRLTFMVGFWTRDVREGMGDRVLYSPCGPLPPPVLEHSWVIQSQTGYTDRKSKKKQKTKAYDRMIVTKLPSTSPAWEKFSGNKTSTLTMPKELDHGFFVSNAPYCFTENLFDKRDHID